jgi:predicted amidohydrolase YtcJ
MPDIKIYSARKIITMNPANPSATHVAVRDGRILGAGRLQELEGWGHYELDTRFSDKVLMPGFVEGHSHLIEGVLWRFVYCGFHDRMAPDGKVWTGLKSIDAVVARLRNVAIASAASTDAASKNSSGTNESGTGKAVDTLIGWGFDPIYFGGARCQRADLDKVDQGLPHKLAVGLWHASLHIINVNSETLSRAMLLRAGVDHLGIPLGGDGLPTGEMKGPEAMFLVQKPLAVERDVLAGDERGLHDFAKLAIRTGTTTAADLANPLPQEAVDMMKRVCGEEHFPVRIVSLLRFLTQPVPQMIERALQLKAQSSDRLRLGVIKAVADGSIQGFSARLKWPGYFNGAPNGLWYVAPEQLRAAYALALKNGLQFHTHTNGDEASEMALDAFEAALREYPVAEHRFTIQHGQMLNRAQFKRMKGLGLCANLFANHHYYWGDAHYSVTMGPERALRSNACATALAEGVPLAIHSDAPVTPLGPLFTAWCAVNRLTSSGRVQGEAEKISVSDALHAITLGPAYTFKLDHEVGSIETGKHADFAVLEDDPLSVAPEALKDIVVWGTVQGGRVFQAT